MSESSQTNMFTGEGELDRKFREFHEKNPHVYKMLVDMTKKAKERGRTKVGIGMLFEVVRWEMFIKTTDVDFKLNNNYRSRYARKIMADYPELDGFFETRELKT